MAGLVYIIPIVCCLVLRFGFGYIGEWSTYLWVFLAGEATVVLIHWILLKTQCLKTEYLGSIITGIYYEEPWTELVERHETKTDSKGRTYTVKRIEERHHSESYYFITSRGSSIGCSFWFFDDVRKLWRLPRSNDRWTGREIKGGVHPAEQCAPFSKVAERWGEFSNFGVTPIMVEGVQFKCAEQLFQCMKFSDLEAIADIHEASGQTIKMKAKKWDKAGHTRADWGRMIVDAMKFCLNLKYEQVADFRRALEESKGLYIVEDHTSFPKKQPDTWG